MPGNSKDHVDTAPAASLYRIDVLVKSEVPVALRALTVFFMGIGIPFILNAGLSN